VLRIAEDKGVLQITKGKKVLRLMEDIEVAQITDYKENVSDS